MITKHFGNSIKGIVVLLDVTAVIRRKTFLNCLSRLPVKRSNHGLKSLELSTLSYLYFCHTIAYRNKRSVQKYPVPWMHIELILEWDRNHSEKLEYKMMNYTNRYLFLSVVKYELNQNADHDEYIR